VRAYSIAREERVGLIDFDAHNDLRSAALDGPGSGTPFRQLIDGGFIQGRNATQVGLHGFLSSPLLKEYADSRGLRMVSAREVRKQGIQAVLDDALERAARGTDGIYVSLDIDVMDPAFAPGTVAPCPGGLTPGDIFDAVYRLGACPQVRALDLVEVDPLKDVKGMTTRLATIIILSFMAGVHHRLSGTGVAPTLAREDSHA
jgi:formiminoglutamase